MPRIRSSSSGCPTDSWTWSESCWPSRITVVTRSGRGGAASSWTASAATRGALATSWAASTTSHPPAWYWPRNEFGQLRCWRSPSPTATASIPAPAWVTVWSRRVPSLDQSTVRRRHRSTVALAWASPATDRWASQAASSSSTRSARGTANGSRAVGVDQPATAGSAGASRTGSPPAAAEARATSTARRARSPARPGSTRALAANPQRPSTSTLTPSPLESSASRSSTRSSVTVSPSVSSRTHRTSAYPAPASTAASRASSVSSSGSIALLHAPTWFAMPLGSRPAKLLGDHRQVGHEALVGQGAGLLVGGAEDGGGVDGGQDPGGEVGVEELAPLAADPERAAEEGLGGGRAEQNQDAGLDHLELGLEPGEAGVDLLGVGLLVDAHLAPALELEVLDHVGHVRQLAVDAGLGEGLVEDAPGRAHEGPAGPVLAVARLLADQHHLGAGGALAEHGLGGVAVQVAGRAPGRGRPQLAQLGLVGDQVAGRARGPVAGWHGSNLPTTRPGHGNAGRRG